MADPSVLALVGVVVSALVAALGYYGKLRHDRQRTTKVALFHLLRMYFVVATRAMTTNAYPLGISAAFAKAMKRKDLPFDEMQWAGIRTTLTKKLEQASDTAENESKAVIGRQLHASLIELAKDEPLLAVRLSRSFIQVGGRGHDEQLLPKEAHRTDSLHHRAVEIFRNEFQAVHARSDLEVLRDDVRLASRSCGLLTWLDVEIMLWRLRRVRGSDLVAKRYELAIHHMVEQAYQEALARMGKSSGSAANSADASET